MENGILRSCGLFALTALCVNTSLSPVIAEQPRQTREGIITTFAPLVEKVAEAKPVEDAVGKVTEKAPVVTDTSPPPQPKVEEKPDRGPEASNGDRSG